MSRSIDDKVRVWIMLIIFCVVGLKEGVISKDRTFKAVFIIGMYISWAIRSSKKNTE